MTVYLVTWDLNREKPNYAQKRAAFVQQVEAYDHTKDGGLDSVRFVSTTNSAQQVSDYLRQRPDGDDRLIVTKIDSGQHHGWLSKPVWDWINARL